MKKRYIVTVTLSLLGAIGISSCDLDREPKRSLSQETAMQTIVDARSWEAGLLARLRTSIGGDYTMPLDVQADELVATQDYGNNYGAQARWANFQSDNYQARDNYASFYITIKNANFVIARMPKLMEAGSSLDNKDKAEVKKIIGTAYFMRAYSYLNLALRYGKSYTEATAATELSVPVHTVYDFNAKPPRSTNKDVYALILADLAEAETHLAEAPGQPNAQKVTVDAVKALKARTLLYMQKYAEALQVANAIINSSTYALMGGSEENMKNYWFADGSALKEGILLPGVSFPDEPNRTTGLYLRPTAKTVTFSPYYLPTKTLLDLYDAQDTRKNVYFWSGEVLSVAGVVYQDLSMVGKFRGNPSLAATAHEKWGVVPDGRMRPKILRLAEQYLIAAEAAYHTNGDALTPLNALRESRGLAKLTGISGDALLKEIQDERQRELAFEGFRLFDLRRWGKDVVRNNPQPSAAGTGYYVADVAIVTYKAGDHKFVWPIPKQDVEVSGKGVVVQNPGY